MDETFSDSRCKIINYIDISIADINYIDISIVDIN